ncbi:hypothetical protein LJB88_01425 [Erysipelotrichaceae bacterium OttesenSCG-928-M19]|nr:hypothetical protein [Erysipelotrichaceae bacterium OttesenSCG-928-M19]
MKTIHLVWLEYRKWRHNWDDLCNQCGKCCYARSYSDNGKVIVDENYPCEYLNTETNLCSVFEKRYQMSSNCASVNLFRALFSPLLPDDCAYARTFRVWKK